MKRTVMQLAVVVAALGAACGEEPATPTPTSSARPFTFDFNDGPLGWTGEVAHY